MKTIKLKPAGTKEVEITLGNFRLTNGIRFSRHDATGCEFIPVKEKLALEAKSKSDGYYVIAFIKYDEDRETCDINTIGPRFHEVINTYEDWKNVQTLIKAAYNLITVANCNKEDD